MFSQKTLIKTLQFFIFYQKNVDIFQTSLWFYSHRVTKLTKKTLDAIEIHIISFSCVAYSLHSLGSSQVLRDQHKPAFLCCKNEANNPAIILIVKIVFLSFNVCA